MDGNPQPLPEFNGAIIAAANELIAGDAFKAALQKEIEQSMSAAITAAFSWGKTQKLLKEKVDEACAAELDKVSMPHLMHFLGEVIEREVIGHFESVAEVTLKERLKATLKPAPDTITVPKIIDMILDPIREGHKECPCDWDESQEPEIEWERKDYGRIIWHNLRITFNAEHKYGKATVIDLSFTDGQIGIDPRRHNADNYDWHRTLMELFQMYAQGTKVTDQETFDPDWHTFSVAPYTD